MRFTRQLTAGGVSRFAQLWRVAVASMSPSVPCDIPGFPRSSGRCAKRAARGLPQYAGCTFAALALVGLLSGCGNGNYDVPDAAARMPASRLELRRPAPQPLRIPADEAFNVKFPSSTETGTGKAEAHADSAGKAWCRARASDVGTGEAGFQLGHKFDLSASGATVLIKFDTTGTLVRRSSRDDPDTKATAELLLFVKNTRGAVVRTETLLGGEGGAMVGQFHRLTQFEFTAEPDVGYYAVLSGTATAAAGPQQSAEAAIEVTAFNIELLLGADAPAAPSSAPAGP